LASWMAQSGISKTHIVYEWNMPVAGIFIA
jgi:hypothetical protein